MKKKLMLCVLIFGMVSQASALDFGIRGSGGQMQLKSSADSQKYFETELHIQHRVSENLALRAAVFGRSLDDDEFWGVQVSAPLSLYVQTLGLSSYMALGYRFMNKGFSAPTLESGLNFAFLGGSGLGYRLIFNEWVKNGLKTEAQFFFSVSFGSY